MGLSEADDRPYACSTDRQLLNQYAITQSVQ